MVQQGTINGKDVVYEKDQYGVWVAVMNYEHYQNNDPTVAPGSTFPQLPNGKTNSSDVQSSGSNGELRHVDAINQYGTTWDQVDAVRLEATTENHSRKIHYFTENQNVIDAVVTTQNSNEVGATQLKDQTTFYSDHTANLPEAGSNQTSGTNNRIFGYEFPMYEGGAHHWALSGNGSRWEVDDYPDGSQFSTVHRIWVRVPNGTFPTEVSLTENLNVVENALISNTKTQPYGLDIFNDDKGRAISNPGTNITVGQNGNNMILARPSEDEIRYFTFSTSWDIGTTTAQNTLDTSTNSPLPSGVEYADSGNKLYIVSDENVEVCEYNLSTPYDPTTRTFVQSYDVSTELTQILRGMTITDSGSKLHVSSSGNNKIAEYTLTTPYDLSTASLSTTREFELNLLDIAWSDTGSKIFTAVNGPDDNLDYFESGSSQLGWENDTGFTIDSTSQVYGDNSLQLNSPNTLVVNRKTLQNAVDSASERVEYSLKIDNQTGNSSEGVYLSVENSGTTLAQIRFTGDGSVEYAESTGFTGPNYSSTGFSWSADTIYDIEIVMDFDNNQFDLVINTSTVQSGIGFFDSNTASQANELVLSNNSTASNATVNAFFDRLTYTASTEGPVGIIEYKTSSPFSISDLTETDSVRSEDDGSFSIPASFEWGDGGFTAYMVDTVLDDIHQYETGDISTETKVKLQEEVFTAEEFFQALQKTKNVTEILNVTDTVPLPENQLTGYYPFDNDLTDEITGLTGTSYGSSFTTGINQTQGLDFPQASDYASLNPDSFTDWYNDNSISVSIWVKTTDQGVALGVIQGGSEDNPSNSSGHVPAVVVDGEGNGKANITMFWHGNTNWVSSTTDVNDGNWHHIVGTYDASTNTEKIFVDGTEEGSRDPGSQQDFNNGDYAYMLGTEIGNNSSWQNLGGTNLEGQVEEFRTYAKPLSSSEVTELYENQTRSSSLSERTIKSLNEKTRMSENLRETADLFRATPETVNTSGTANTQFNGLKTLSETTNLQDNQVKRTLRKINQTTNVETQPQEVYNGKRQVNEAINIQDSDIKQISQKLSETIKLNQLQRTELQFLRNLSEKLTLNTSNVKQTSKKIFDPIAARDNQYSAAEFFRTFIHPITVLTASAKKVAKPRSENIPLAETSTPQASFSRNSTEAVTLSDSVELLIKTISRNLEETVTLNDNNTDQSQFFRANTEDLEMEETLASLFTGFRTLNEDITLEANLSESAGLVRQISEIINIDDTVTTTLELKLALQEALKTEGTATAKTQLFRKNSETLTVQENLEKTIQTYLNETTSLTENIEKNAKFFQKLQETFTLSDNKTVGGDIERTRRIVLKQGLIENLAEALKKFNELNAFNTVNSYTKQTTPRTSESLVNANKYKSEKRKYNTVRKL